MVCGQYSLPYFHRSVRFHYYLSLQDSFSDHSFLGTGSSSSGFFGNGGDSSSLSASISAAVSTLNLLVLAFIVYHALHIVHLNRNCGESKIYFDYLLIQISSSTSDRSSASPPGRNIIQKAEGKKKVNYTLRYFELISSDYAF